MTNKSTIIHLILLFLLILLVLIDLSIDNANFSIFEAINNVSNNTINSNSYILTQIRIPRVFTAVFTGFALSVSGLMMQTLFHNPLADPYVLGISSGASLGVATSTLIGSVFGFSWMQCGGYSHALSAVSGAAVVLVLVLGISAKIKNNITILVLGIVFGSIASSFISLMQSFCDSEDLKHYIGWTLGSLDTVTWSQLVFLIPTLSVALFCSFLIQKKLNAYLIGEKAAQTLGINPNQVKIMIVVLTSILSGLSTAFTGPIGFIGIAVPHLVRNLYKTSMHNITIPGCMLCGADILLCCDILTHLSDNGTILPVNSFSALIGGPIIIHIILKSKIK